MSSYFVQLVEYIYKLNFKNSKDYTKIIILLFFRKYNYFVNGIEFDELVNFVYDFYIDNIDISEKNPNKCVNKITYFKPYDLLKIIHHNLCEMNTIFEYISVQNDKIYFKFFLTVDEITDIDLVLDSLSVSNFAFKCPYDYVNEIDLEFTYDYLRDIHLANKSKLRNRVLKEHKYCCCCDNSTLDNLLIAPISLRNLNSPNNYLLMCEEHLNLYINGKFRFDEHGRIKIYCQDEILDDRMHLSIKEVEVKKEYLKDDLFNKR